MAVYFDDLGRRRISLRKAEFTQDDFSFTPSNPEAMLTPRSESFDQHRLFFDPVLPWAQIP